MKKILLLFLIIPFSIMAKGKKDPFFETVDKVDLNQFAGSWYVYALIPTFLEENIYNGVETYTFVEDDKIKISYTYNKKSLDGPKKEMKQRGWIINSPQNSQWKISPFWPLKFPYYIIDLAPDYSYTVIATNNYKYLWILTREVDLDQKTYEKIVTKVETLGFDRSKIKLMEHSD